MKRLGRKGTEKPIEIFVALFVILAVSLVMLKLFQNQITQKQQELQAVQQESKQLQLAEKATLACKDRCNAAGNDGCSLQSLANFCISYGSDAIKQPEFLDYNGNQLQDYDITKLVGVGLCEDKVPCHALVSSCCGQQMSGSGCREILRQYWVSQGFNAGNISCLVKKNVLTGGCTIPAGQNASFWFYRAGFDTLIDPAITCT
jgi:hypothetical protein